MAGTPVADDPSPFARQLFLARHDQAAPRAGRVRRAADPIGRYTPGSGEHAPPAGALLEHGDRSANGRRDRAGSRWADPVGQPVSQPARRHVRGGAQAGTRMTRVVRWLAWSAQPIGIVLVLRLALGGPGRDFRDPLVFSG